MTTPGYSKPHERKLFAAKYKRINNAFKVKWLEALESGDYKKAQERLARSTPGRSDRFCCLGVAGNLLILDGKNKIGGTNYCWNGYHGDLDLFEDRVSYLDGADLLPRSIQQAIGLSSEAAEALAWLNDHTPGYTKAIQFIKEKL